MTDEPQVDEDVVEDPADAVAIADEELPFDDEADEEDITQAILAEANLDRLQRQAYWHGTSKQMFAFLFANCLFLAGALVAWTRSIPGDPPGDPSTYITGMHTIRGALIFALAIYGFWTAVFNIWYGQMRIWPYLLNAILALWVGIAGFKHTIGSEAWDRAKEFLDSPDFGSKTLFDDITVPLSTVAPGYWLLTFGGLVVVFLIVNGLMQGRQSAKGTGGDEGSPAGRRRR